jgi:hypothetical protein
LRGAAQKNDGPPRTFAKSQTHPPADFFFPWHFVLVRFRAFLGKGSSKTPYKYFCKKSMSKTFPEKNRQKFRCQFFLDLFRFIAVSGVSQRWEFKNTTFFFAKEIVSKTQNRLFLDLFFITLLGVSRSGEVKNTIQK